MKAIKSQKRERRHNRIRAKVLGTTERPRFSVFRSNKYIYAQIINDEEGKTLVSASDRTIKKGKNSGKVSGAKSVGTEISKLAKEKNITKVVFDRGGYLYAGRVKAVSEGAREGGLSF
jgi:large subunit ribosomal protein L18